MTAPLHENITRRMWTKTGSMAGTRKGGRPGHATQGRTVTDGLISHSDKCVNCFIIVRDKVRSLFEEASTNRNLEHLLLTDVEMDDNMPRARLFAGVARHPGHEIWRSVFGHLIRYHGLTAEERTFTYCLNYLVVVESMYRPIVDRVCYMLAWRTNPPKLGNLKHCENGTFDEIRNCRLVDKIEYLRKNGFGYLANACDTKLRNAMGHMAVTTDGPVVGPAAVEQGLTGLIVDGPDVRIKRSEKGAPETVDVRHAIFLLEKEVRNYIMAFSECRKE